MKKYILFQQRTQNIRIREERPLQAHREHLNINPKTKKNSTIGNPNAFRPPFRPLRREEPSNSRFVLRDYVPFDANDPNEAYLLQVEGDETTFSAKASLGGTLCLSSPHVLSINQLGSNVDRLSGIRVVCQHFSLLRASSRRI